MELKLNEINESTLHQLQDYLDQKAQILGMGRYWDEETPPKWVGVLVGNSISPGLQEKLSNGYEYTGIPMAGMTIRRFRSNENEIFVVSDTFFSYRYSNKDYSRFLLNGKEYNKGRLVNAAVEAYVEAHPMISFAELKAAFPDDLQGNLGVFDKLEIAEDIYQKTGHKRYYIKPEETIDLKDAAIATCTQWNPTNINAFVNRARDLGLSIELK